MYISTVETFLFQHLGHTCIFCGDFNLSDIKWANDNNELIYFSLSAIKIPYVPKIFEYNRFCQKI